MLRKVEKEKEKYTDRERGRMGRDRVEDEVVAEMESKCRSEVGKPLGVAICGTLVYYHCAYKNSSILSLLSDVLIVLLCSLAILGLLFRQMNISYVLLFSSTDFSTQLRSVLFNSCRILLAVLFFIA